MSVFALYALKSSVSLAVVWIFYQLLLRRLTFYNLNRWYLLFYSLLSFFIPLIDIGPMVAPVAGGSSMVIGIIPSIGEYAGGVRAADIGGTDRWGLGTVLTAIGVLGSGILLARLLKGWWSIQQLKRNAILVRGEDVSIYQVNEPIAPFSFGNSIFLNRGLHSGKELEEILSHELVHIRQRHTVDILLSELFVVINWYNPFVWLLRHSVRQNLEFIADNGVLEKGSDRKSYQYHLLKAAGGSPYLLANQFNFSSLKKRIIMMNKIRSARLHLVKFLFILPLIVVLLVSFRNGRPVRRPVKIDPRWRKELNSGVYNGRFFISKVAGSKKMSKDLLYIIDGKPARYNDPRINPRSIYSIDVPADSIAEALYGKLAAKGMVAITTKTSRQRDTAAWGAGRYSGYLISDGDTVLYYDH